MPYAKVLVVDDVDTNLDVAKGLMGLYGMKIDCVLSGNEAIAAISNEKVKYDAIFMDHMMPEMDGIETVRRIREDIGTEYAKNVPIIALTANAIVGNEKIFFDHGFQAFLSKPIDVKKLDEILYTWIRSKHIAEEPDTAGERSIPDINEKEASSINKLKGYIVDGIDFNMAVKRYENEEAYLNILRSFNLHTPGILGKMRAFTGINQKAIDEYRISVHGLKGSCYGICANAIGDEAKKLEMAAISGDIKEITANNNRLINTLESLLAELDEVLKKISDAEIKKNAHSPDPELLAELCDAAKDYKAASLWRIMQELESYNYETGSELVVWLRKQLDELEYDAIYKRLEEEVKK